MSALVVRGNGQIQSSLRLPSCAAKGFISSETVRNGPDLTKAVFRLFLKDITTVSQHHHIGAFEHLSSY
jgi:hypothetical protein